MKGSVLIRLIAFVIQSLLRQQFGTLRVCTPFEHSVLKPAPAMQCEDPFLKQSVTAALAPPPPVPEPKPKKGQPVAPSPEPKRPRLSDTLLVQAVRGYLTSGVRGPECRRNGFILDGFPKTLAQSQLLFAGEGCALFGPLFYNLIAETV